MAEFENAMDTMHDSAERQIEEGGLTSVDPENLERMVEAAKKMEESSTGEHAKMAKLLRIWTQMMQRDTLHLQEHIPLIAKATDYSNIRSTEEIDKLSAMIKKYLVVNTEMTEKIKHGWITEIKDKAKQEKFDDKDIKSAVQSLSMEFGKIKPQLLIIRKCDEKLCNAVLEQHSVLKTQWEKWTWNAEMEAPDFQEQAAIDAYNEAAIKIQAAGEAQLQAQKKMFEIQ